MSNYNTHNTVTTSEKKVWQYIQIAPCPHEQARFFALQELLGAWVWNDEKQKAVFEKAKLPAATRVVYMEMDEKGFASNVNSEAYNGDKLYK